MIKVEVIWQHLFGDWIKKKQFSSFTLHFYDEKNKILGKILNNGF